jgi:hypothetical protein
MNRYDRQWQKLVALARQAPAEAGAAPYGFATRVTALAVAQAPAPWVPLERFALRGLLLAAVCSAAAVAFNFTALFSDQAELYTTGTTDTVVELLDIS